MCLTLSCAVKGVSHQGFPLLLLLSPVKLRVKELELQWHMGQLRGES